MERLSVTPLGAFSFCFPENGICCTLYPAESTVMHMPETSVNQYCLPKSRKHDIRLARQLRLMQPKPVAHFVNDLAYFALRCCVLPSDASHAVASLFRCQHISHMSASRFLTRLTKSLTESNSIPLGTGYKPCIFFGTTSETAESRISIS